MAFIHTPPLTYIDTYVTISQTRAQIEGITSKFNLGAFYIDPSFRLRISDRTDLFGLSPEECLNVLQSEGLGNKPFFIIDGESQDSISAIWLVNGWCYRNGRFVDTSFEENDQSWINPDRRDFALKVWVDIT
jgi:hypothetical protein